MAANEVYETPFALACIEYVYNVTRNDVTLLSLDLNVKKYQLIDFKCDIQ